MNQPFKKFLQRLKAISAKFFGAKPGSKPKSEQDPDKAAQYIYEALTADKPCMIARYGQVELTCVCNYLAIKKQAMNPAGQNDDSRQLVEWGSWITDQMQQNAGFFPATPEKMEQFSELIIRDTPEVDILGSWLSDETTFDRELQNAKKVRLCFLDPYWAAVPWTKALEGKKVLVVHPFTETIGRQYKKRELLFQKNNLLPEFKLTTIKAVQSIAGTKTPFADWFEALDYMKAEIDKVDYDICLIGCGAYGFPLAAHVKRTGKKAFHLGGSLQLLFGIIGNRWADKNYSKFLDYSKLMNEHWVKPSGDETPVGAGKVEGACYW